MRKGSLSLFLPPSQFMYIILGGGHVPQNTWRSWDNLGSLLSPLHELWGWNSGHHACIPSPPLSPHSLSILPSFLFSKSLILQCPYLLVFSIIWVARSSIWIWHLGHNKIVQTTSSASSHFYLSTIASNTVLDLKVSEFLLPIVNRHTKVNF